MSARDKQIADFLRAEQARERGEEIHDAIAAAVCGRPLIGHGTTTWDQLCQRPAGHRGACSAKPDPAVCQCWKEGQYGRVHREDCPIHADPPGPVVHAARNPLCSCGHRMATHLDGEDGLACSRCGCVRFDSRYGNLRFDS